ncbi:MAG: signal peptidase II [Phycisphaerales bacterium]|nr:signal peptidase II [Phycisphaerales bacterium]
MTPGPGETISPAAPGHSLRKGAGAWRSRRAWIVLFAAVVFTLVIDLGTKSLAFARLADTPVRIDRDAVLAAQRAGAPLQMLLPIPTPRVTVVPHVLDLTLVLNPGAVFGIGAGKRWFFVVFTLAAIGFVLWIFARHTGRKDTLAHLSAGLLIGGGLGNLYDRLLFACVRDFLHPLPTLTLPGGRAVWPYVSNVADALLIVGIAGLLLFGWRQPKPKGGPAAR